MIGNSQGFKKFCVYLKNLLVNYFKLSIIFLKNLFEKNLKSKYYFSCFYSTLCKPACRERSYKSIYKECFANLWLSANLNYRFIKYYFPIFLERIDFKTVFSIFLMQAKLLYYAHKVLFKNIFYFENMFLNGLKHCSKYLRALGICLIWIETFCKRFGNKSEIRK
jgi:hypothetical protein